MSLELSKIYGYGCRPSPAVLESFWLNHPLYEAFAQTTDLLPSRAHITSQADAIVQSYTDAGVQMGQLFLPPRLPLMNDFQHIFIAAIAGRCLFVANDGRLVQATISCLCGTQKSRL